MKTETEAERAGAMAEQARRRQWSIEDGRPKRNMPVHANLWEAIEKDENGEHLTRNERRILAALDNRIAKDKRRGKHNDA